MAEAGLELEVLLPPIREELQLIQGGQLDDGAQGWLIFDPTRHRYFQIDDIAVSILGHWHLSTPKKIIAAMSGQDVTLQDIEELLRFLFANSLTLYPPEQNSDNFVIQASAGDKGLLATLIHNYLFFRVPLIRPHHFLKRTVGFTNIFFQKSWWIFVAVIALMGVYLTVRQWDQFMHTFMYFFSLQGLALYFLALVFVKFCHELGHAYTATRYGCRVATMGVAFLVMFPVLYTDTTDSWKIISRRKRLEIASAGVAVEIMIAVFATLLWVFIPDGPFRSAAFFVATTSWILSIAVNTNPLMRFDGYYFLSDAIRVENLQERSFALGRWAMREILFGFGDLEPESMEKKKRNGLIIFSWCVWVYRFFLFLGIALLVHELFFKALGIFLFIVEIGWFIVVPISKEIKAWFSRRSELKNNKRAYGTLGVLLLAGVCFVVPWHSTIHVPAVIEANTQSTIYSSFAGEIKQIHFKNGDRVEKGDLLAELYSPDLHNETERTTRLIRLLKARLDRIAADSQDLDQKAILQSELTRERKKLAGLVSQQTALNIHAPIGGIITDANPQLHMGRWINQSLAIALVKDGGEMRIRGYVSAESVRYFEQGAKATFVPDSFELSKFKSKINSVRQVNAEVISIPALVSRFGGPIAVAEAKDELRPLKAWYGVTADFSDQIDYGRDQIVRGHLKIEGQKVSFASRVWRQLMRVLRIEMTI